MTPPTFDIVRVLTARLHMSERAAICALSHGQVYIDDRCLGMGDRMVEVEENRGRLLRLTCKTTPFREYRLGSRRAIAPAQRSLV